jgi:mutator protein MutT
MPGQILHLSVSAVIRDVQGRLLLVKRSRRSSVNPRQWEFPGGKLEPGERIDEGLRREVREETGLDVHVEKVAGSTQAELAGRTITYIFLDARAPKGAVRLSNEHEDYRWIQLDELLALESLAPQYGVFVRSYCQARGFSRHRPSAELSPVSFKELEQFVRKFERVRPRYKRFAAKLQSTLEEAARRVSPLAVVQARPKSIASFAEKILRKNKYIDPLKEITDLCGARVITQLKSEAEALCGFISENFLIDQSNSLDTLSRLRPGEFGYRSVHYVVQFDPKKTTGLPKTLLSLKAEIQVRTMLQHVWSDIGHDRLYKSGFKVPQIWEREAARVAASLENADDTFARVIAGLEEYNAEFGRLLQKDELDREIALLRTRLRHDKSDVDAAHRLARLRMNQGNWAEAISILERVPRRLRTAKVLCCLGSALCETQKKTSAEFRRGRGLLREAVEIDPGNIEAFLRLAETAVTDSEKMRFYQKAFEADPRNPAALAGYIRQKILAEENVNFIPLLRPDLEEAIRKCELQAGAKVNVPRAFYRVAEFHLFLGPGRGREVFTALAHGVRQTASADVLTRAIDRADILARATPDRMDVKCAIRFLVAARQAKFPTRDHLRDLRRFASKRCKALRPPVVIVAGGCDPAKSREISQYRGLLRAALADFNGTLISGGTKQGISGLVGELRAWSRGRIFTVGYLPSPPPQDRSATIDHRYGELRWTDGRKKFSVIEPVQNWIDLIASGIPADQIRLIGINGGEIAALEYRLAWALGARVGIVRDSGREADVLEQEVRANEFDGMLVLPPDAMTLRAFIHQGDRSLSPFTPPQEERLARMIHARFLEDNRHRLADPSMREWEFLSEDLKQSNREQVAYMPQILKAIGRTIVPLNEDRAPETFGEKDLETMGRMEHGRWNIERLRQGWHHANERNPEKRLSPYLVPWDQLDENVKSWDRTAMAQFATHLAEIGCHIQRE